MLEVPEERAAPGDQASSLWHPVVAYDGSGSEDRRRHPYAAAIALAFVVDAFAVLFACALSTHLVADDAAAPSSGAVLLVFTVWMILLGIRGLHALEYFSLGSTGRRILTTAIISLSVFAAMSYLTDGWLPKRWLLYEVPVATVAVLFLRMCLEALLGYERRRGELYRRALVVGDEDEAEQLAARLTESQRGFQVVGRFALWRRGAGKGVGLGDELKNAIRASAADCVYVTCGIDHLDQIRDISHAVRQADVEMRVASTLPEMRPSRLRFETLRGVTVIAVRPVPHRLLLRRAKRALDIACAAALLVLSLPLWAFIAVAQKRCSRGPILFVQTRVGEAGRLFRMYKFRTMVVGAEHDRFDVLALNEAEGPLFKIREDPRITKLGKWLRRWSLDELPQLWNVLRGEMSLVGPRPPLPEEVHRYERAWHSYRLDVPPGMTGLWQVSGRSDLSFEDYVRLDLKYVENWSFGLDLLILLKTIPAVLSRRGAS